MYINSALSTGNYQYMANGTLQKCLQCC